MADDTLLRKRGIQRRFRCSAQIASQVESAFTTVENLIAAVESDRQLTDYDGVGPRTADAINDWWDNRFERERAMDASTVERTSSRSATIHLHTSWSDALETTTEQTSRTEPSDT